MVEEKEETLSAGFRMTAFVHRVRVNARHSPVNAKSCLSFELFVTATITSPFPFFDVRLMNWTQLQVVWGPQLFLRFVPKFSVDVAR
jgi:hypothetical protein